MAVIDWGQPQTDAIHRQNTPATLETALEHHFQSAAIMVKIRRNRLSQPQTDCQNQSSEHMGGHHNGHN